MTTNEASRAEFEKWAVSNDFYMDIRRDGQYASTATSGAWLGYQAALASRPVDKEGYVAVGDLEGLADEWENMKVPRSASSYELGNFDGYRGAMNDLRSLIDRAGER